MLTGGDQMNKWISALLSLILCLSFCSFSAAEDYGLETKMLDLQRIEWAVAMTSEIAGSALEQTTAAQTERERHFLTRFSGIPYLSPDKAVVLEFSEDQVRSVKSALGITGSSAFRANWEDVGPALAEFINQQFSTDYTRASRITQAEGETTIEYSRYFTVILLSYGEDISVTSLTGWGNVNSRSAMIISTREISQNLGEADIDLYIQKFGVDKPPIRVYEKIELDQMIAEDPWGTSSDAFRKMADTILASATRREAMLPAWMQSESLFLNNSMKVRMIISALRSMETADQSLLRSLIQDWMPMLSETSEDPVIAFLEEADPAAAGRIAPPAVSYGEELHGSDLKADGTFLTVFDLTIPDQEPVSWYDMILEAALPLNRIPESVEAADYIIRCSVTYDGGVSSGDAHLHYPLTHITVHDARTGEMLRDLGSAKRRLNGVMMLSAGDTWWDPLYTQLWPYISTLFSENE